MLSKGMMEICGDNAQVAPKLEVVFLDTQYHFAETMWYIDAIQRRYDLNLRVITPDIEPDDRWLDDPDAWSAANARRRIERHRDACLLVGAAYPRAPHIAR